MLEKPDWDALAKRVLHSIETGEREFNEEPYTFPASNYTDPDRWRREVETVFKRSPVVLAFAQELDGPDTYLAIERVGVAILLTRGSDGVLRGFLNACRHRGAVLTGEPDGCGKAKVFVCPYHAWTYDNRGNLIGIPDKSQFGPVPERFQHLVPLAVEERAGLIWGVLTPGIEFDLDTHLGGMLPRLEKSGFGDYHVFDQRALSGANWKIAMDGYFENYHFMALHKNSFGQAMMADHAIFEEFGPHCEFGFSRVDIRDLSHLPQSEWKAHGKIQLAQYIFPNLVGAHKLDDDPMQEPFMFFSVWPGAEPGTSITHMTALTLREPKTEEDHRLLKEFVEFSFGVVDGEDYWLTRNIQRAVAGIGGHDLIFGRMERLLTHYHRTIDALVCESEAKATASV